jgi:hypothetical protein
MGSLTLPPSGPMYLDANGFIYSVERIEPYRTLLEPMWQLAQAGQFEVVSSELVILETLVKPLSDSIGRKFGGILSSPEHTNGRRECKVARMAQVTQKILDEIIQRVVGEG